MIANIGGGGLMFAVHLLNKAIPASEYGNFGVFLAVVMLLPTIPLQMVLTQQTAKALATGQEGQLAGIIRWFWGVASALWLVGAILVLIFQRTILEHWHMTSPVGLWVTLPVVLLSLWLPMFWGMLQGRQNFFWLGWTMLVERVWPRRGCGGRRAAFACVRRRDDGRGADRHFRRRGDWLLANAGPVGHRPAAIRRASPAPPNCSAPAGVPGFTILFTADTIFVKTYFTEDEAGFYVSAGTLSRALMWLVLPLASVMFPRLVHSAAKSEKSNLMSMVLLGTAILSVVGALGLSLLGPWVVRFVFKPEFVKVASGILPWYASAMVPLALANVLLNNLLARPDSKLGLALWVFGLSLVYMFALTRFHAQLTTVLQTLGVFNLVLLAVCAWFSWKSTADPWRKREGWAGSNKDSG